MAYKGTSEYPRIALRVIRSTFRFSGRSTRTEFGIYYLAAVLFVVLFSFTWALAPGVEYRPLIIKIVEWAIMLPLPALFVRRMHDQDRTGWWALIPLTVAAYNITAEVIANREGIAARIAFEQATWFWDWIALPPFLVFIVLFLLPGTQGPNRYGPDPRTPERSDYRADHLPG